MSNPAPSSLDVDVAVLGAGTAGLAAYRAAAAITNRTVLVEAGPHGTTCARVGCMPSKLLVAAADAAHRARHAGPFGLRTTVEVDGRAVMDRVRRERDRFVGFVVDGVARIPVEHVLLGRARFVAPGQLELTRVDGGRTRIRARAVVVATGSSPTVPAMFDPVRDRVVVNDDVFGWEALPTSVAVFGAGVIGLELGQALARLSVRTRIFGRGGAVGPITDPAVKAAALAAIRADVAIDPDATVHGLRRVADGVEIHFADAEGNERHETFEHVLVAAGRRPNLTGLGLEHAGLRLDARGLPAFDRATLRAEADEGVPSVFLAGDVNDDVPLLHEAADEGRIAGENAARAPAPPRPGLRRSPLAITFSDPQLAVVGATHATLVARARGSAGFVIGAIDFSDQGRSRVMRENRGLGHLYADTRTGRLLGAELAGPRAEHLGHLLAWSHQQGLDAAELLQMPFYHPVVEEGLRTALRDAFARLNR